MTLSLAEVLELDPLRRYGARLVAAKRAATRTVSWVHSAEVLDIARFLQGGELLLTTGIELERHAAARSGFVAHLAAAGAAGLAVELHRAFDQLPDDLVGACEREQLPLVTLDGPLRHVEITRLVHAAIVNRQLSLVTSAEAMGRSFTALVLAGADLPALAGELAARAGCLAVVEDAAHQILAFGGRDAYHLLEPPAWGRHSRRGHQQPGATGVALADDTEPRCAWLDLWLPDGLWGRVHLVEADRPLDELSCLFLDRAGAGIQIALRDSRQRRSEREAGRSRLLEQLLGTGSGREAELLAAARALGADFAGGPAVALWLAPAEPAAPGTDDESEDLGSVLEALRAQARQDGTPELSARREGAVAALVRLRGPAVDPAGFVGGLERRARRPLAAGLAGVDAGPGGVARAFAEARTAFGYARSTRRGRLVDASDLGLEHLLETLAGGPDLARFVEHELAALLRRDAASQVPLLPTLRAVLDHPGSRSRAAAELGIDRRTLYHRLDAASRVLGHGLDDPAHRRALEVALVGLDLLEARARRPSGLGGRGGDAGA